MDKKSLLIFPAPGLDNRTKGKGVPSQLNFPSKNEQSARMGSKMSNLEQVFLNQTASFHPGVEGQFPEMLLVFEIAGSIDSFFGAIKKTEGMEYLSEQQIDDVDPDDFFFKVDNQGNETDKPIENRIFLSMTNQEAIKELLNFWDVFKQGGKLPRGKGKYIKLFQQLKDIRPYSVQDRIRDTGLENYLADLKEWGETDINFEIELAYRNDTEKQRAAFTQIERLLNEAEGEVIEGSKVLIPEIKYLACIARAPIEVFDDLTENTNVQFLKSEKITFFRPVGQMISNVKADADSSASFIEEREQQESYDFPVAALLDGFPLANHSLLKDRLIVDDPNGVESGYLASGRYHGTAMASLILHGDLDDTSQSPSPYPLLVHPIMRLQQMGSNYLEELPANKLPIDLIHTAVRRIFEGDGEEEAIAPSIKIINLSIGDLYRPFQRNMSAWAKLIDWLSEKYNVLFIISTGNYPADIIINQNETTFAELSIPQKLEKIVEAIIRNNYDRKILTPSESVNAITVGACHDDASAGNQYPEARIDLLPLADMMSLISRIGFGFSSSIKPDILMPGGRKLFRKDIMNRGYDPNGL